jgi:peptidoglycan DL-endopeptidase CwlO
LLPASAIAVAVGAVLLVASATATTAAVPPPTATTAAVPPPTATTTTTAPTTTAAVRPPATTTAPTTTSTATTVATTQPAAPVTTTTPPPATDPPPTTPPEPTPVERVVAYARTQLGRPYRRGAAGPDAFDCSGLTRAAYLTVGIELPHGSILQAGLGHAVDWRREAIRPGDLVFMRGDTPVVDLGHVGVAVSATEWIVAPRTGQTVQRAPIPTPRIQRVSRFLDG